MAKIIITLLIGVISYGLTVALSSRTLISPWIPVSAAVFISAITGIKIARKWKAITGVTTFIVNYICHVLLMTGMLLAAFYVINFAFADKATTHTVKAVIERRYSETRYKSRRIRRNVYGRGEPYKVYFIELRFENGMKKSRELNLNKFNRTHKGDTLNVDIAKGALSIPVIEY